MRKIYNSFMAIALIASAGMMNQTNAQDGECLSSGGCPFNYIDNWPLYTINIAYTEFQSETTESYVGDHMYFHVHTGVTYTWSFCPEDGASAGAGAEDAEFVLFDDSNNFLCYSNDYCGTQPKIVWTATYTGTVTLQFNVQNCQTLQGVVNNTIVMKASEIIEVSVDETPAVTATFDIYPNPANDFVTINYKSRANENVMIQIISAEGRVVYSGNEVSANGFVANINVKNFAAGMYFMQLTTANGILNKKFLVQ